MLLNCGAGKDSWEFLGQQEDQMSQSKGNQPWIFTDAEAWTLRQPDAVLTHWERPWCWERLRAGGEGVTDEMVGWHPWLNGYEFEQTSKDSEGQGSLACCCPWDRKESDTT